jgi:amidase
MAARDLCFTPAVELLKLYRARRVSPLEVLHAVLARIDAVNPDVNAIVTLVREDALRHARLATAAFRRGADLPPLFGVPLAIKDVTPTKGIRTTHGSKLFESHVPDEDALVVQRLRAAGAIVIGKTNTPEFAFGPNTVNAVFGATRNPWNLAPSPPAAPAAARRRRWPPACARWPRAPISAARCAAPRPIAGSSGSARRRD